MYLEDLASLQPKIQTNIALLVKSNLESFVLYDFIFFQVYLKICQKKSGP